MVKIRGRDKRVRNDWHQTNHTKVHWPRKGVRVGK
jgi:hypothetical protein